MENSMILTWNAAASCAARDTGVSGRRGHEVDPARVLGTDAGSVRSGSPPI